MNTTQRGPKCYYHVEKCVHFILGGQERVIDYQKPDTYLSELCVKKLTVHRLDYSCAKMVRYNTKVAAKFYRCEATKTWIKVEDIFYFVFVLIFFTLSIRFVSLIRGRVGKGLGRGRVGP